jgi:hypothetical protein
VEVPLPTDGFDVHLSLDRLPAIVPLTPEVLRGGPYLTPEPEVVARWSPSFQDRSVLHVGLHWQAEAKHLTGKARSIALSDVSPLFEVPRTKFYSLQPKSTGELAAFPMVTNLGNEDEPGARFVQTAGIISCLDLVICCDSSIGHLSGAIGVPVWMLLGFARDPMWGLDPDDTPWYPAHRLFSQHYPDRGPDQWLDVITEVRDELAMLVRQKRKTPT